MNNKIDAVKDFFYKTFLSIKLIIFIFITLFLKKMVYFNKY